MSWSLVVDTSTSTGRLAAVSINSCLFSSTWEKSQRHNEELLKQFKILTKSLSLKDLSHVYCTQGPGSFTGLRVCGSFIKTLSYALNSVPITGISSFAPMAQALIRQENLKEDFSIFIPSVSGKSFRSDFNYVNDTFKEKVDLSGALLQKKKQENSYTTNKTLAEQMKLKEFTDYELRDLIECVRSKQLLCFQQNSYTHLDFYPLYLRKSEAEEKFRYDTTIKEKTKFSSN